MRWIAVRGDAHCCLGFSVRARLRCALWLVVLASSESYLIINLMGLMLSPGPSGQSDHLTYRRRKVSLSRSSRSSTFTPSVWSPASQALEMPANPALQVTPQQHDKSLDDTEKPVLVNHAARTQKGVAEVEAVEAVWTPVAKGFLFFGFVLLC